MPGASSARIDPLRHPAALSNAISRRWRPYRYRAYLLGAVAGLLVGGVAAPIVTSLIEVASVTTTSLPTIGIPWAETVWIVAFVVAFAWSGAWGTARWLPRDVRAAMEAYIWLATRAEDHWRAVLGVPVPRTVEAQRTFLDSTPVAPATAGELATIWLAMGDLDTARQVLAEMPDSTPAERHDHAAAAWLIEFVGGGEGDLTALQASLAEIPDARERLERQVNLAVDASRVALARGEDWIAPMAAVRPTLGEEPARIMWSFAAVPAFRRMLGFGAIGAIAFWVGLAR